MGWYVLRVHIWYILSGKDWASNRLRHARGHDTNCEMLCLAGCEDADSCKYKDADSCKYKHTFMQIQAQIWTYYNSIKSNQESIAGISSETLSKPFKLE